MRVQGAILEVILEPLGSNFGIIMDTKVTSVFGCVFDSILDAFWSHLDVLFDAFGHPEGTKVQKVVPLEIVVFTLVFICVLR